MRVLASRTRRRIDSSRLVVVAFIQQGATGRAPNVLQAAQAAVTFAERKK